jgi:hypothetical protein
MTAQTDTPAATNPRIHASGISPRKSWLIPASPTGKQTVQKAMHADNAHRITVIGTDNMIRNHRGMLHPSASDQAIV